MSEPLAERWLFDQSHASRAQFSTVSLDLLADHSATTSETTSSGRAVMAELRRREMVAQIRASEATAEAALQSKRSAVWMKWSVIVAAIATVLAAAFSAANLVLAYRSCH